MDETDMARIYALNPCIYHGTDILNMKSILRHGLYSNKELCNKKIQFNSDSGPEIQEANDAPLTVSIWIFGKDKYEFDNQQGPRKTGTLSFKDKKKEIENWLSSYDYYFVINSENIEWYKPLIFDFPYEGLCKSPIIISDKNILAVVRYEQIFLDEERTSKYYTLMNEVDSLIKELNIPLIKRYRNEIDS